MGSILVVLAVGGSGFVLLWKTIQARINRRTISYRAVYARGQILSNKHVSLTQNSDTKRPFGRLIVSLRLK
jgi:hypothetical protein